MPRRPDPVRLAARAAALARRADDLRHRADEAKRRAATPSRSDRTRRLCFLSGLAFRSLSLGGPLSPAADRLAEALDSALAAVGPDAVLRALSIVAADPIARRAHVLDRLTRLVASLRRLPSGEPEA